MKITSSPLSHKHKCCLCKPNSGLFPDAWLCKQPLLLITASPGPLQGRPFAPPATASPSIHRPILATSLRVAACPWFSKGPVACRGRCHHELNCWYPDLRYPTELAWVSRFLHFLWEMPSIPKPSGDQMGSGAFFPGPAAEMQLLTKTGCYRRQLQKANEPLYIKYLGKKKKIIDCWAY